MPPPAWTVALLVTIRDIEARLEEGPDRPTIMLLEATSRLRIVEKKPGSVLALTIAPPVTLRSAPESPCSVTTVLVPAGAPPLSTMSRVFGLLPVALE